jgi:hypothetical protein
MQFAAVNVVDSLTAHGVLFPIKSKDAEETFVVPFRLPLTPPPEVG